MRLDVFAALRFLRTPSNQKSLSVLSWFSIGGAALGVASLILAVAILNGFRHAWQQAIQATSPHIRVESPHGAIPAAEIKKILGQLQDISVVQSAAPYAQRQTFLRTPYRYRPMTLHGVYPHLEEKTTRLTQHLLSNQGPWETPKPQGFSRHLKSLRQLEHKKRGVFLGQSAAAALGVFPGDSVEAISTHQRLTPLGPLPLVARLEVLGVFSTGLDYVDDWLAITHHETVSNLHRMGNTSDGVGLRLKSDGRVAKSTLALLQKTLPHVVLHPWSEEHGALFKVMRLEKVGISALLGLVGLVGLFNIMAVLLIQARTKQRAMAAWMAIGASPALVKRTFLLQGACLGFVGSTTGMFLGLLGCWAFATFNIIPIPQAVFPHLNRLPIMMDWRDLAWILGGAWGVSLVATPLPMRIAMRTPLVELLRNE